jgi:glutamate racemase
MIEAGEHDSKRMREVLTEYVKPLLAEHIDTLILGCTHYGIIAETVRSVVGKKVKVISEAEIMPEKLKDYLSRHPEYDFLLGKEETITFYTTDTTDRFEQMGSIFFGEPIQATHVSLPTH